MDYRVLFSQRALDDLAETVGHIADDDPEAAAHFGNALLDHVDLLGRFPRMGDSIRKRSRVRKLLHSPILVYYVVREDKRTVEVLHLRHGSRKSPKFWRRVWQMNKAFLPAFEEAVLTDKKLPSPQPRLTRRHH